MQNFAFGDAVATDDRDPEQVAEYVRAHVGVVRRPAAGADYEFARDTHHRAFRDLVESQYGAWVDEQQDELFESSWTAMPHEIILSNGVPCGYLCVEDRPGEVQLHELVLRPDSQGRGVGAAVLNAVIEHARARRVPVRLRTHRQNRAANLYRRIGFHQIGTADSHLVFEWSALDATSKPGS
ncbi:MAG: GNAT family N-acetyltransferase [Chloroflexota bacterium]